MRKRVLSLPGESASALEANPGLDWSAMREKSSYGPATPDRRRSQDRVGEGELRLSGAFRAVVPNGLNRGGKLRRPTLHARKGQKMPFYSQNVTRLSGSIAKPLADYSRDRPYEVAASGEVPTASCVIWVVVSHGHVLSAWSWMQFHERRGMRAVTVQLGCRGGAGCGACAPALERASTCVRARPQR